MRRILLTGVVLTASAFAQMSSFPKPNYFREVIQQTRTKVELRDPVRLRDFVVADKLELSLKNYLELVMANNTDVQVAFLSLETPKNNVVASFAGPGGAWDPSMTARFSAQRSTNVLTTPSLADTGGIGSTTKTLSQPLTLTYSQSLDIGTQYSVTFGGQKTSSNNVTGYNPRLTSNLAFSATQNLLRGRGRYINRIGVMQAQSTLRRSEYGLRSSLLNLINNAELAYWSVINARESLNVQIKNREATLSNYDFVKKQLDLGAISELDIFNPEGQVASADLAVAAARFRLASALDSVRHQIGADLDPEIRKLDIELTEPVDINTDSIKLDPEQEVAKGLNTVPAIKSATESLDFDDLSIQSAKNNLLPSLSFQATYTNNGTSGSYLDKTGLLIAPGGLYDSLGQVFGLNNPTYFGQLSLTLPIRSRTASINYANTLVGKKNDVLALRNQQQAVRLNVLNAVTNLNGAIEQLKLARKQAELQAKNVDAEKRKFELGTETNQFVVNALQQQVAADAQVVTNLVAVRTSVLQLLVANGTLLDERNIIVK